MFTQVLLNREKWLTALMLDPETGLDPPGIKLRAAEGVDGASSFLYGEFQCHSCREDVRFMRSIKGIGYGNSWELLYRNFTQASAQGKSHRKFDGSWLQSRYTHCCRIRLASFIL